MKLCILAYDHIKESRPYYLKLVDALKSKFDSVLLGYIGHVTLEVEQGKLKAYYKNTDLTTFDAILPRIGPSYVDFGYLVLKSIGNKVYFPNKPESYLIANNKFHTLMSLAKSGIPIPRTFLCCSRQCAKQSAKEIGGKIIIKKVSGKSGGRGVVYCKDLKSSNSVIDAFPHPTGGSIFVEEFLKNPGEDIRLFVIDREVVAVAKRKAKEDDIRSNIHVGGTYEPYTASEKLKDFAVQSARLIGADICGVDIIPSSDGPKVIELNMNPGFAISDVSGVNVFGRIADFVYKEALHFRKAKGIENVFFDLKDMLIEGFNSLLKKR